MAQSALRVGQVVNLVSAVRRIWAEVARFGVVGLAGLIVDLGVFNALRFAGGQGPLYDKPLTAKALSVVVATLVTFLGNRHWTYRHRRRRTAMGGYVMFFLLNAIGMAIALLTLFISHYLMNWQSALADNISANVVGLGLGTLFRFWSYRRYVFPHSSDVSDVTHSERDQVVPGLHD